MTVPRLIRGRSLAWPKLKNGGSATVGQEAVDERGRKAVQRRARQEGLGRRRARPAATRRRSPISSCCARGRSTRQVKAIADAVEETLRAAKMRPAHVEGYDRGDWVLMDFFTLHRPRLHAADAGLLFARAAVGRRGAHRDQRRAGLSRPAERRRDCDGRCMLAPCLRGVRADSARTARLAARSVRRACWSRRADPADRPL